MLKIQTNAELEMPLAEVFRKIVVAERQVRNGELLDGEEVLMDLREKYVGAKRYAV